MIVPPSKLPFCRDDDHPSNREAANALVYADGTCQNVQRVSYRSSCSIDVRWFPFDEQVCELKFIPWTYSVWLVNITLMADSIDVSSYLPSSEWDLVGKPINGYLAIQAAHLLNKQKTICRHKLQTYRYYIVLLNFQFIL